MKNKTKCALTLPRVWALGAPDPEMERIDSLLRREGENVVYATADGRRVHAGNAYRADDIDRASTVYWVECAPPAPAKNHVFFDHHRPGDRGYGRSPRDFFPASSLGQVVLYLARRGRLPRVWDRDHTPLGQYDPGDVRYAEGRWVVGAGARWVIIPSDLVISAAADHCLRAAYAGLCPGVEPAQLAEFRLAVRAQHRGRSESSLRADIDAAIDRLGRADCIWFSDRAVVRDMRGPLVPELPEAAAQNLMDYIAGPIDCPDGRQKIVVSGRAATIEEFFRWAPPNGLIDTYGDPARGFAGGYIE